MWEIIWGFPRNTWEQRRFLLEAWFLLCKVGLMSLKCLLLLIHSFIHSFKQSVIPTSGYWAPMYVLVLYQVLHFFFSMFNLPSLLFNHMGYIYTNYFNVFPTITRIYVSSGVVTMDWFFLLIMGQIFLLITADMIDMKNDRYGTFYHESESLKSIFICMPRL